jgi:hypothetical protein
VQGRPEERPDDLTQLFKPRNRRMGSAAEHPPQVVDIGAGAYRQAQAAGAVAASFGERTAGIGSVGQQISCVDDSETVWRISYRLADQRRSQ